MAIRITEPIETISIVSSSEHDVARINSLATKYKKERQESKAPTFALTRWSPYGEICRAITGDTYQGTWSTLVKNCGFSKELAKKIEARYHELYRKSDAWVNAHLVEACRTGYVTAAFGLRVRTPLLKQVILGTKRTPAAAEAEGRTAGNALGQSWCLLNNRAGSEFMAKVRESKFKHSIKPCAQIHDAQYYLIKEDMEALLFTNEHLVKAVNWNDHPDIYHPEVGLGGEVSIFHPTWANEIVIPNEATEETIMAKISEAVN